MLACEGSLNAVELIRSLSEMEPSGVSVEVTKSCTNKDHCQSSDMHKTAPTSRHPPSHTSPPRWSAPTAAATSRQTRMRFQHRIASGMPSCSTAQHGTSVGCQLQPQQCTHFPLPPPSHTSPPRIRIVIPRGMAGIAEECRARFQRFLDLADWKGMNVAIASRQGHRATDVRPEKCWRCDTRKFRCQPCPNLECSSGAMTLAWLAKMNAEEAGGQEPMELESVGEIADRLKNLETGQNEADLRSLELSVGRQPEVFFKGVWRWLATIGAGEGLRTSVEVEREGGLQVLECVWPMVLGKLHPLRSRE